MEVWSAGPCAATVGGDACRSHVTRHDALERDLQGVVLASFPVLPYDDDAAHWHSHERSRLERAGKPVPYVDGQIAAIAFANSWVLVTVKVKDLARFRIHEVDNWSKRGEA